MSRAADQPATCGTGLAENSALPAKLAELIAALAEVLEAHRGALDLDDDDSRREDEAYRDLAERNRAAAAALRASAASMAGSKDLPMGRHHAEKMAAPPVRDAFWRFVESEQKLLSLLQKRLEQDRVLLSQMGGTGR